MTLLRCRVCDSQEVAHHLRFPEFPCHIWPLASEAGRLFQDADVYVCQSCGHLQLQDFEEDFIRNLYVHETCNVEDPGANLNRVKAVEKRLGAKCFVGKRTLDIGGGRNGFSSSLPEGEKWICDFGVSEELRRPGVRVVEGDFLKSDLPPGHFDFISMFHTLEHFNNPGAAVMRMAELLAPGGLILVEVPNVRSIAEAMPYYAVFHQHISMFASETLAFLFKRFGLLSQDWFRQDRVLFAAFRKEAVDRVDEAGGPPDARLGQEIVAALERRLEAVGIAVSALGSVEDRHRVGLYGAGGSSTLFLAHFPCLKKKIGICFDLDLRKQGRFLPGTDIRIHKPEAMRQVPLEQLIFLSSNLHKTVGADLSIQTIDVEQVIRELPDVSEPPIAG